MAVWLSAINAAKARIARLIIAIPVTLTQQLQTPLLIPARQRSWDEGARTTLVRKKWHPSSSAVQSLAGSTGEKFGPNVYKLSIETHQMMH